MDPKIKFDIVIEFLLRFFALLFVGLVVLDFFKPRSVSAYIRLDLIFPVLLGLFAIHWSRKSIAKK